MIEGDGVYVDVCGIYPSMADATTIPDGWLPDGVLVWDTAQIREAVNSFRSVEPGNVVVYTGPMGRDKWLAVPVWVRVLVWPDGYEYKERTTEPVVQELIWGYGYTRQQAKAIQAKPPVKGEKAEHYASATEMVCSWSTNYSRVPDNVIDVVSGTQSSWLGDKPLVALDFETDGRWKFDCLTTGLAVAGQNGNRYFVGHWQEQGDYLGRQRDAWNDAARTGSIVFHNAPFDVAVAKGKGWKIPERYDDTLLMAFCAGEKYTDDRSLLGLKHLAYKYLGRKMRELEDFIPKKQLKESGTKYADAVALAEYAKEDARATLDLYHVFKGKYNERVYQLELDVVPVLHDMEDAGFNIDPNHMTKVMNAASSGMQGIERWLEAACGWKGNVNSTQQVAVLLYDKLGLRSSYGRGTGKEPLVELGWHPVAKRIRAWRKFDSLYEEAEKRLALWKDMGKVVCNFNQYGAGTGRFSSSDPVNEQNVTALLREAYIPDEDERACVVYRADYAQIELRIAAVMSGDEAMLAAIRDGVSLHRSLHKLITDFGVQVHYDDVKKFDFTFFYGGEVQRVQEALRCSEEKAQTIMDAVLNAWPRAMAWRKEVVRDARENGGHNTTLLGRDFYYPLADSHDMKLRTHAERTMVNKPVQGTGADVMKLALREVPALHKRYGGKMRRTVHDEIVGTIPLESWPGFSRELRSAMLEVEPRIPLDVEIGYGANWKAAKAK